MSGMFLDLLEAAVESPDAAVDEELRELELASRRLEARRAALIAVAHQRGTYRADGHRSIGEYLRALGNMSRQEANRLRRVADACAAVPALGDALLAGRIGVTQILVIGRIQSNPRTRPFFERVAPIYLARAEHDAAAELRDEIDSFINLADEDGAFAEMYCHVEQRTATVAVVDGTLDVRVTGGDALVADEVLATFRWFVEREFRRDVEERAAEHGSHAAQHPLPRSDRQRRFDAVVAMTRAARAHGDGSAPADVVVDIVADPRTTNDVLANHGLVLTAPDDPTHDVEVSPDSSVEPGHELAHDIAGREDEHPADEVRVVDLSQDADELIALAVDDPARWIDRRCRTANGTPIHPELLLTALLTGHVRRVVTDDQGTVIDWGRKKRLYTGPARAAAKLLIKRCTHPGCSVHTGAATVDHVDEWVRDAGRTDQRNADVLCSAHNRFKSRAGWRTRRDVDGRTWRLRPDGSIVLPVGARPPTFQVERLTAADMVAAGWIVSQVAVDRLAAA